MGLGLFGAKSAIESWGGTFSINSTLGAGTSIQILLPEVASAAIAAAHPGRTPERAVSSARGPLLVLIDDDPSIRALWGLKARDSDLSMIAVASFGEWETEAADLSPDTPIFIDYLLGGESGVNVAAKLHARGFARLYITTGKDPGEFYAPDYILEVVGKRFPKELFVIEKPST